MKDTLTQKTMFLAGILIFVLSIIIITACNNPTDNPTGEPSERNFTLEFDFELPNNSIVHLQDVRTQPGN